jgi:hypothetical protein
MTLDPAPPQWAERLLQAFVPSRAFESVSGDLLEEYRDTVFSARGAHGANLWYVSQVLRYGWRTTAVWATLFATSFVGRTAMDWRLPTADFYARSTVTTSLAVAIFLLAGLWAGFRSRSLTAGPLVGILTAIVALPIQLVGAALLLALWHDPVTLSAAHASGGLAEVFTLPLLTVLPCILISCVGGMIGATISRPGPA